MNIYDFKVKKINGEETDLSSYQGKALLIVNTASQCGFTPQYNELEKVYESYSEKGLEILGFPCNQFGGQEPGSNEEIQNFCDVNFGIKFPIFEKIEVNGKDAHPLYQFLKRKAPGLLGSQKIKWNFTKFLVSSDGKTIKRFAPTAKPSQMVGDIERAIEGKLEI